MELKWVATREGRLSSFLLGELKMSTGLMNKLKWGDSLRVNGVPQRTNYPVRPGDVITVTLAEETPEYPAEDGELSILYEDEAILAVEKPAGMLIHPSRAKNTGTLANYVAGYYRKTGQNCAFHPMTRLDRDTFGIVLLAKNAHIHSLLQSGGAKKTYHALVYGGPNEDSGTIDAPIARRPLPSLLRYVNPEGKPSVTQWQVLEQDGNMILTEGLVLQDEKIWKSFLKREIIPKNNSCELYFEEPDLEGFAERLERLYPDIHYVNRLMTHSWGQKVIRFYDLDGNLIEVGTPV